MESPLSRTPSSTSIYAPGSHRRAHPNASSLHLSLAPLTPKFPISTSDYDAYFDPSTSQLHTSSSLSHIATLPSPTGILSRNNSRSRLKRKTRSHVSIHLPSNHDGADTTDSSTTPSGALTSQGFGGILRPKSAQHLNITIPRRNNDNSSWLVQTGLALTESSRENKGQSWISKRESSTSLISMHTALEGQLDDGDDWGQQERAMGWVQRQQRDRPSRAVSRRTTPAGSRAGSRSRRSRRTLAMTPAGPSTSDLEEESGRTNEPRRAVEAEEDGEEVVPDWADEKTQSEVAAQLQSELVSEFGYDDGDPYGMLDFEGQVEFDFDSEEEAEFKKEVAKTKRRLFGGGWFQDVVDAMVGLEGTDDLEMGKEDDVKEPETTKAVEEQKEEQVDEAKLETPPEGEQGVWADVRWLGRLITKSLV